MSRPKTVQEAFLAGREAGLAGKEMNDCPCSGALRAKWVKGFDEGWTKRANRLIQRQPDRVRDEVSDG